MKEADDTIVAILTAIRLGAPPRLTCESFGVPWADFAPNFDHMSIWAAMGLPIKNRQLWEIRARIYEADEQY